MTNFWFLFGIFIMKILDKDKILCQLLKAKIMVKKFSVNIWVGKKKKNMNVCMSGLFQRQIKIALEKIVLYYEYNINQCFIYQGHCHLKFSLWFSLCIKLVKYCHIWKDHFVIFFYTMCIKFLRMLILFDQIFSSPGNLS